jgi:hypothetical protein
MESCPLSAEAKRSWTDFQHSAVPKDGSSYLSLLALAHTPKEVALVIGHGVKLRTLKGIKHFKTLNYGNHKPLH